MSGGVIIAFGVRLLLVALFAAMFLGERLSAFGWLGVALVGAGSVLVAVKG